MSRSQALYHLQQIDSKMDQAHERLKEIDALLSDNANLRKATALANKAQKALESAQKAQKQAETRVNDQRIKIEQSEAILYGGSVRNPKELQDLQSEVAALKRFLETLEERQLETMLAVDEAHAKNQEALKILKKYRAQAEKQQAELIQERDQIQRENGDLLLLRKSTDSMIAPEDLEIYESIRKQRGGVAVAKVKEQACGACGSTLTAALFQAARSPSQVVLCDSCGRILYAN
jgi:predicted  nucleic acid-binding Zn-ribbon protein